MLMSALTLGWSNLKSAVPDFSSLFSFATVEMMESEGALISLVGPSDASFPVKLKEREKGTNNVPAVLHSNMTR